MSDVSFHKTRVVVCVAVLAVLAAGCSSKESKSSTEPQSSGVTAAEVKNAQEELSEGISPYTQYVVSGVGQQNLVPVAAATKIPVLLADYDGATSLWFVTSNGWDLPTVATDGVPSEKDLTAFNKALVAWNITQTDYSNALIGCAGKVSLTKCLADNRQAHSKWENALDELIAAEAVFAANANDSKK